METKKLSLILIFNFAGCMAGAQDIIYKKSGEEIKAVIVDVTPGVVKYKKFKLQNSPVYSIAREQVEKITYESGKTVNYYKPEEEKQIIEDDISQQAVSPASTIGGHIGFGGSKIRGDLIESKWQLASTIGASFNLAVGSSSSVLFGLEILSVGCGLEDDAFYDSDTTFYEITNWRQDMGYIGLEILYRQYFNPGRNYFLEIGFYGSFLINAEWEGEAVITEINGASSSGTFQDDLIEFYNPFDYGITAGVGGRIPLGESKKWHITLGARFYYGLQKIFDYESLGLLEITESNIYGLVLVGVDIPTTSSQ